MRPTLFCIVGLLHFVPLVKADEKSPSIVGLWEGPLKISAIELRLGFKIARKDGNLSATMDSIDQGALDIPVEKVSLGEGKLVLEVAKIKATFTGTIADDGKSVKGEWKQGGATFPLELKRVEMFSTVNRPQMPKKPYPYDEEDVVFENKGAKIKLAGTLTKPKGDGPFVAAILITGSGPQDRDETLLGHKPFLIIADHLTRKGIAVLRVDDRGTGKSTGDFAKATTADFATDVRAAIAFLKDRKDIKSIGLIGHSEGGVIAPMVAADSPDVAFIVMLAGTGFPGDELLIMQGRALMVAMKASEKQLKWQSDLQTRLFKLVKDGADAEAFKAAREEAIEEIPEDERNATRSAVAAALQQSEGLLTSPWLRYFLLHDPRNDLKKVRCPVLALNGEKDLQVPAKENLAAIEKTLKKSGNKNVTVRELPNLNHLFQTCKTGLPNEYGKIEETFAPAALELIGEWILKRKQ